MPVISKENLIGLAVVTKSGLRLGKVAGFELDAGSHLIVRYTVRPRGLTARMLGGPLLIARQQVVSIDEEKMVVEDGVEKAVELEKAKAIGLVSNT